jgi:AAA15 family ATPase/GTPase
MYKIKELRIKNFKAFQEEQVFNFTKQGKNLLVYGNNGSGKSSLFWALYTLFQSSTKEDADVEKYFENYLESNTTSHQSLKNIFMEEAEDAFIKLIAINTETEFEQTFTISKNTINTNNDDDNTLIQELNIASDFINYKLLHNFYNGSHKTALNIWPVFERDIFPLLTDGTQNWLEDIIKVQTKDVDRTPRGNVVSQNRKIRNIEKLDALNEKIVGLLSQI